MTKLYVKLWRIDGQQQRHIAGKSFKIESIDDVVEVKNWVEETIREQLMREVGEDEREPA